MTYELVDLVAYIPFLFILLWSIPAAIVRERLGHDDPNADVIAAFWPITYFTTFQGKKQQ